MTATLLLLLTTATAGADYPKCFSAQRDGHCIEVQINGQPTDKLTKRELKKLQKDGDPRAGAEPPAYKVTTPVAGPLRVDAEWIDGVQWYFGDSHRTRIHIYPLDGQELHATASLSTSDNVRAEGKAIVTRQNMLNSNVLPPGRYLASVRMMGENNWDRQVVLFTVSAEE